MIGTRWRDTRRYFWSGYSLGQLTTWQSAWRRWCLQLTMQNHFFNMQSNSREVTVTLFGYMQAFCYAVILLNM